MLRSYDRIINLKAFLYRKQVTCYTQIQSLYSEIIGSKAAVLRMSPDVTPVEIYVALLNTGGSVSPGLTGLVWRGEEHFSVLCFCVQCLQVRLTHCC